MNSRTLRIVLAIVVVAAAIGAWQSVRRNESEQPAPAQVSAAATPSPASSAPPPAPTGKWSAEAGAPGTPNRPISFARPSASDTIAFRYDSATDRRALLDELTKSPEPSASYFAACILRDCADVATKGLDALQREFETRASAQPQLRAMQAKAFNKLKAPCATLYGRQISAEEIEGLEIEGARRGDPRALALGLALGRSDPPINPRQLAEQLLDKGDPYAITDVATWLAQQTGRMTIMGAPVANQDIVTANLAWQLVACDYGRPCGPDSPAVLNACAFDGLCDKASYEDLIRSTLLNPQQYQRAIELRARIIAALQAKDYASLGI